MSELETPRLTEVDIKRAELIAIAFDSMCEIERIVGVELDLERMGEIQLVVSRAIVRGIFVVKDAHQHA